MDSTMSADAGFRQSYPTFENRHSRYAMAPVPPLAMQASTSSFVSKALYCVQRLLAGLPDIATTVIWH